MWLPPEPNVDLERLHKATATILSHGYRYRGEGITFAYLYLMVGEIQLANEGNHYLYVTDTDEQAREIRRELSNLAVWEAPYGGMFYSEHNLFRLNAGPVFHFTSAEHLCERIHGKRISRIFWDVSEERCRQLGEANTMHDIQVEMNVHLLPDGDIV